MRIIGGASRHPGPERLAALRDVPLFGGCSDRELASIDGLVDDADFSAGELLVREGMPAREAFVVVAGSAEVLIGGRRVSTLGPGALVGEMALIDGQPRSASVRALTAMHVLALDPRNLTALLGHESVARRAMRNLSLRLRDAGTAGGE